MNVTRELLCVRKPTKIDRVIASVPRPPNSQPPRTGMPLWQAAPLYWKLPIMSGSPKETTVLYREKLGNELWKAFCCAEYYLKDPNNKDVLFPYDSQHDPHLKRYFKRKHNREHLEKQGFITKDGDVLCNLEEYNLYRRYLYRLHLFNLHNAIWWNDMLEDERFELRKFNEHMQRDISHDERDEYFHEATAKMREERLAAEEEHRAKLEALKKKKQDRSQWALERRMEERAMLKEVSMEKARRFLDRQTAAQCAKRHTALRALRNICNNERALRQRQRQRKRIFNEELKTSRYGRWNFKVESQLQRFAREEQLLMWDAFLTRDMMELRDDSLSRERRRMEDLLERIQAKHVKQLLARKARRKTEQYVEAVTKAWGIPEGVTAWKVEQAVISALARTTDVDGGTHVLAVLHEVKQNLDKAAEMPEEVTCALDTLLDNVVKEFIRTHVLEVMENVQGQILDKVTEISSSRVRRRSDGSRFSSASSIGRPSLSERRRSSLATSALVPTVPEEGDMEASDWQISSPPTYASFTRGTESPIPSRRRSTLTGRGKSSTQSLTRTISFGEVQTIGKFVPAKEMQPVKDRPPTPHPSLEELAAAVLEEPAEVHTMLLPEVTNEEKEKLNLLFKALQDTLLHNVTKHFERKVQQVKRIMHGLLSTQIRLNDVVRRLTEKIASSTVEFLKDSDELHMAEEYLIQELQGKVNTIEEQSKMKFQSKRPSV